MKSPQSHTDANKTNISDSDILFSESQKFRQWWLWLILVIALIAPVVGMFYDGVGENLVTKLLLSAIPLAILVLMFVMRLKTVITNHSIKIHYFPFITREWKWEDLRSARIFDYGFIGGWGIRLWTGYGTVYNVSGSKGLHFKTSNKEYIIGTQKENQMRESIAHLLK
jgi:hypothetical protein